MEEDSYTSSSLPSSSSPPSLSETDHNNTAHPVPDTTSPPNLVEQLKKQYERASSYLLDIYSYQFLPLDQRSSCISSSSSVGELSEDNNHSSSLDTGYCDRHCQEGIPFRDRVISIMAPSPKSVNPFDNQNNKDKDKNHTSKDCRRLSCEAHKKCCGSDKNPNNPCKMHESNPMASSSARATGRAASRSETKSTGLEMKKRSSSCPRGPLFPIPTTLAHLKRTEYNKDKLSPGSSTASLATSNVSVRSKTPTAISHVAPTFVTRPTSAFTALKTPSSSKTLVLSGSNRTPVSSALTKSKTPIRTTPKISTITGKPIPVTEIKAVRPVSAMGRKADVVDAKSGSSRAVALASKSSSAGAKINHEMTSSTVGRQNSQYQIRLKLNLNVHNDDKKSDGIVFSGSSSPDSRSALRRLSLKNELDETGSFKVKTTNIQVAVRLRPFSRYELDDKRATRVVRIDRDRNCVAVNDTEFEFNKVFDSFDHFNPADDQASVYREIGKPLLEHALNGYNVCLFAYGQTGSGKTYSITGLEDDIAEFDKTCDAGIIPRFVHDLFLDVTHGSLITLTYIEIYNDQIYNLLTDPNSSHVTYKVREHPVLGPYIPNLIPIVVENSEDLLSHIAMGNMRRAKAATASNEHSSRSHAIVTISVHQKSDESFCDNYDNDDDSQASEGERIMSKINIVDLAGSERVAAVQSTGDRFKEGTCINKSLLTLGKVISELSAMKEFRGSSKNHIPYRESTLTFLLKESLGGNSKTCMLATISPSATQVEETLSTLRYASKASRIINRVRINEDPKNRKIRLLEFEVQRLKLLLESQRSGDTSPVYDVSPKETSDENKGKDSKRTATTSKNRLVTQVSSDTTTSPDSAKSSAGSRTPSVPSSIVSTPKKTGSKKTVSETDGSSVTTTPTKTSTPVVAKRKGKDQATVTERRKDVDQGTSTDELVEEVPVIDVGDYKSNLLEKIEHIFEGKQDDDVPKSRSKSQESKTHDSKSVVSPQPKERKTKSPKNDVKTDSVETIPKVVDTKSKKSEKKTVVEDSWAEDTPAENVENKSKKSDKKATDDSSSKQKESKKKSTTKDSWSDLPKVVESKSKDSNDSWNDSPAKEEPKKKDQKVEQPQDSWSDSPAKVTETKSKKADKKSPPKDDWGWESEAKSDGGSKKTSPETKSSPAPKKNKGKGKKSESAVEDDSVLSAGLNTGMIGSSTIDITETDEDASRHVNFQDTQEIRYYQPSIADTTQQSVSTTNGNDTIDISSSSSVTTSPKTGKKSNKKDKKKGKSPIGDLMQEMKDTLAERNEKKQQENGTSDDWGADDKINETDDLTKVKPILANVTQQDEWDNNGGGDDWGTGGNDDQKEDQNNNDDWGNDAGKDEQNDADWDNEQDNNDQGDQYQDGGDDWNDGNGDQDQDTQQEAAPAAANDDWDGGGW